MSPTPPQNEDKLSIADFYPELTPEEQQEAAFNLDRYLTLIKEICESQVFKTDGRAW